MEELFMSNYVEWRQKRLKAITDFYGNSFFKGKTLLELGCGRAHIGKYFSDLGAIVTACDGRKEHINYVKTTHPEIKTTITDLDKEFPFKENFDIVINMGLLYHLIDPLNLIKKTCLIGTWLIIETEVVDSTNPLEYLKIQDESKNYGQSMNGVGVRLSLAAIENTLKKNDFSFFRVDDDRCSTATYKYDWVPANTKKWTFSGKVHLRKIWFCKKETT